MLPKNLKYQNKVESASAHAYISNIQPQNGMGPYAGGQTIIFNIPTRNNLVLIGAESSLKFSLSVTNGNAASNYTRLDRSGAHGVISRLRLWAGSNLIEDVDTYGMCVANLISLQKSNGASKGKYNINSGMRYDDVVVAATNQAFSCPAGERLSVNPLIEFVAAAGVAANAVTTARTYTINLLSILGSLGTQYIPLFAMTSAPLRLELVLCSTAQQFCVCDTVVPASFSVTNVEYIASFIDLADSSMAIINQSLGGQPLQYVIPSFRNYVYNAAYVNGGVNQVTAPIPAKFSSLKHIIGTMRRSSAGAIGMFPLASGSCGLTQYSVRFGSKIVPAKSPSTFAEYFSELSKCVASLSDLTHSPNMNVPSYGVLSPVANTEAAALTASSVSANFAIGIDMETYANADKDSIFSGYNTLTDDIYWNLTFDGTQAAGLVRYDFFALYDSLLICENGTAIVKY